METDSRQTSGSDAGVFSGFDDLKKLIEKFQLPSVDIDALLDWQRRDIDALTEANRQATEGLKALVERRNEILREALAEWQAAVKDATSTGAISRRAEAAKQGVQKAIANFRELSEIEAQSRNNAWKVVQERMQENMATLQQLLQPK
jgi:phasin family protein